MLTTKEEITAWLREMDISHYEINADLTINVRGDVNLHNQELDEIPVQFNKVTGDFVCDYNNLKSLKGSPKIVGGCFTANNNQLISLHDFPEQVGEYVLLHNNKLTSLEGMVSIVNDDFSCANNDITSLKYAPKEIKGLFNFSNNPINDFNHNEFLFERLMMTHEKRIPELKEYYLPGEKTLCISLEEYKKNIAEYESRVAKIDLMKNLSIILEKHEEKSKLKL